MVGFLLPHKIAFSKKHVSAFQSWESDVTHVTQHVTPQQRMVERNCTAYVPHSCDTCTAYVPLLHCNNEWANESCTAYVPLAVTQQACRSCIRIRRTPTAATCVVVVVVMATEASPRPISPVPSLASHSIQSYKTPGSSGKALSSQFGWQDPIRGVQAGIPCTTILVDYLGCHLWTLYALFRPHINQIDPLGNRGLPGLILGHLQASRSFITSVVQNALKYEYESRMTHD